MIKSVIFDFDDTLCLTEENIFHLENAIAVKMGYQPMTREVHLANWGTPLEKAIQQRIPGVDAKEFMRLIDIWTPIFVREGRLDAITLENLHVLDTLKSHGKRLGIVTSRTLLEARHLLHEDHPLTSRLESFYHKDNSDFLKPDHRVFDKILFDLNSSPEQTVYVGDAITDAKAAKEAGLHFIALMESGIRTRDDFADYDVDLFANKLTEVIPYVLTH